MKLIYKKKSLFFLLLNIFNLHISNIALSNERINYELQTGISVLNFGYKEFSRNNRLIDKEDDAMPGLTFALIRHWQDWSAKLKLTNHKGIVTYIGQTQSGIPVTSKTDTDIQDYSLSISRWISTQDNTRFAIYTGYGQHKWHRNIRSTTTSSGAPVNGLDERYYWDYIVLGSKLELYNKSNSQWLIDFQYNYSLNADIDVNFTGFDQITLPLGDTWGFRFASPYQFKVKNQLFIKLEPYYEYWEIDRGEVRKLRNNGVVTTISVVEPRSETQNFGINLSIVKSF